ncbi:cell division protein FtsQ/DivIB [Pseudopedobacter beijingensis]|uniref:Cell division protein FtsQ/DivIB n=1 Tax=Pseudopedobacter beijingensis TaxID=1207056 RepID=A0ABW4IE00_9SPHI
MLKRIKWKNVLFVFLWLVSLSGLVVLMSFIEVKKNEAICKEVKVILPGNQFFLERAEVDEILASKNGLLVGRKLNNINLQSLEDRLRANPFVEYANVFSDMNGIIQAEVVQRTPVLRVFNLAGQNYYIDQKGLKVPISNHFTANVIAVNGEIQEGFGGKVDTVRTKLIKDLYRVATYISKDSLWNSLFVQLYVNAKKDIELVPRVGKHKIILGDANDMEDKFRRLMVFYKKAIPYVGWDTYSTINLKFAGQIVCLKSDSTIIRMEAEEKRVRDSIRKEELKKNNI